MSLNHPFQKLCLIAQGIEKSPILLAASGSAISIFQVQSGTLINKYVFGDGEDCGNRVGTMTNGEDRTIGARPTKRRKLDTEDSEGNGEQDSDHSVEVVAERQKGERKKPKAQESKSPNVSHLLSTSNGELIIAVTAEDKSIHVFELSSKGELNILSKRVMPKRLCALVLTSDEQSILAGDKFGDVYWLPLMTSTDYKPKSVNDDIPGKVYQPSATELTVHTRGNLEALRQQRERKANAPKKEGPNFEHKLLLGHVSLLTDVCITEVLNGTNCRQYILTADRDEHIRVSRGLSQAHVIENYCYGHRDFVSRLCILPWNHQLLVASSGEPALRIYDWQQGKVASEEFFSETVQQDITNVLRAVEPERSLNRLAVSGIWPLELLVSSQEPIRLLLTAIEGIPLLFSYLIDHEGVLQYHQTLKLKGNALDVAIDGESQTIFVTVDTVHIAGSMRTIRKQEELKINAFEVFTLSLKYGENGEADEIISASTGSNNPHWTPSSKADALNGSVDKEDATSKLSVSSIENTTTSKGIYSSLGEFLYGLENLRKKRDHNDEDEEKDEEIEVPA